nr:hypothetical protein Iba_chr01aCG17150 [Ipomoea batatas]
MKVIDGRATTTAFVARQRQYSPVIGVCAELPASSPSPATEATARLGEVSSGGLRFRLQQRPSFLVDAEDGGNNDLAGQSYNAPDGRSSGRHAEIDTKQPEALLEFRSISPSTFIGGAKKRTERRPPFPSDSSDEVAQQRRKWRTISAAFSPPFGQ